MNTEGITINKPELNLMDLQSYKAASVTWDGSVNCFGIGPVTPNQARSFAHRLAQAANKADKFNEKI